jgi:hypothetical protein
VTDRPPYWPPPPGWQAKIDREAAERAATDRANEEKLRIMREEKAPEGIYTVTLTSIRDATGDPAEEWLPDLLLNLAQNPALDLPDGRVIFDRAAHIGPQTLATGVSEDYAIRLKKTLEWAGATVKITEAPALGEGAESA